MKIQSIEFKNIASYGNQPQKIEFKEDGAELFLTLGKNGDGKTTIANAILFALYGKVEGARMSDLPNRINKALWVRIKLKCKGMTIEIERGLAPNKFTVLINGVEFDKAGKKSVQEYLEDEVYGIPYHVFKNIIILSINDFKSFLTMTGTDKKKIIDRMFGFSILNEMFNSIKEERKQLRMDLDSLDAELRQILESITSVRGKLNTLVAEADEKNKGKIEELKASLLDLGEKAKKLKDAKEKVTTKIGTLKENYETKKSRKSSLEHQVSTLKKKISLYESGHCPTCETKLDTEWHASQLTKLNVQLEKGSEEFDTLSAEITSLVEDIRGLNEKSAEIDEKSSNFAYNIRKLKEELIKIKESNKAEEFDHLRQIIKDFEGNEKKKSGSKDTIQGDYNFLEYLEGVLGEDGVKNLAIKTILPALNNNIAAMVRSMDLHFHIRFDEKFNCIITHLGEEVNALTLSTGERKKADFIIIVAIIKILKLRFPQLNLLFLDELLSSVDQDGIYNILKILSQVIKENKINTFVINHTVLPHEIFDKKIQIYRENGFSKFTIDSIE
jgi:DNA repair exonuclease SbcCD ATPase subunit